MKISKIPGLGRFGLFIDDADLTNITHEEWMEIGKLHLDSLVTIIRNTKLNHFDYMKLIHKWGTPRNTSSYEIIGLTDFKLPRQELTDFIPFL
jgi:hypothetical protein